MLIAGGGISGLTAALGLAGAGFRVEVFEQSTKPQTAGAGMQVSPNALAVLDELGLTRRLAPLAVAPTSIRIMSARSGREIARVPLGDVAAKRYGLPYLVVHRADLLQVLASACADNPDITVRYGQSLEDIASHANGVTGLIRRGPHMEEMGGMAAVVADGVWSRLRKRHFRQPPAVYSGYTAWRTIIASNKLTGAQDMESTQLWLSPTAHAVTYPLRAGRALNVVVIVKCETPTQGWAEPGMTSELIDLVKGWNAGFRGLIDPRSRWTKWPLFAMPVTKRMVVGNAVLIGDAAHAMLPFAAQGAAMGIEDAAVLAARLAPALHGGVDVDEALYAYEAQRMKRTRDAARLALSNRWVYHLPFPLSLARNVTMRLAGGNRLLQRQDWLYAWKPEAA